MVRVLVNEVFEPGRLGEFGLGIFEVQRDARTSGRDVDRFHGKLAFTVRLPAHPFALGQASAAASHDYIVGDDECGVETNAKLTDQARIVLLVPGHAAEEFGRT